MCFHFLTVVAAGPVLLEMLLNAEQTGQLHAWIEYAVSPICDAEPDVSV